LKAVILCGGKGTRIREASDLLPKPMLPIGGKPIVWHIMKQMAVGGVSDFVLCLGYKGWVIKEFFLNYRAMMSDLVVTLGPKREVAYSDEEDLEKWNVVLAETGDETQTGGRVRRIQRYVKDEEFFLVTYGDGVSNLNLADLIAFHRAHGKIATVTAVRPPSRFGEMGLEANRVVEFNEKPQATGGFINGGYFLFDARRIWPYLEGNDDILLEQEPMRNLVRDGQLCAYRHEGFWQPMDTLREYGLLNDLWTAGKAPWATWRPRNG
jgi:glucose-1-phosphate cytidylyltransferase